MIFDTLGPDSLNPTGWSSNQSTFDNVLFLLATTLAHITLQIHFAKFKRKKMQKFCRKKFRVSQQNKLSEHPYCWVVVAVTLKQYLVVLIIENINTETIWYYKNDKVNIFADAYHSIKHKLRSQGLLMLTVILFKTLITSSICLLVMRHWSYSKYLQVSTTPFSGWRRFFDNIKNNYIWMKKIWNLIFYNSIAIYKLYRGR